MGAIRTTCPYCGVGCGIAARVGDGRKVTIKGDADHPANRGALCSKGTHLAETVGLEGRLLHPMIGDRRATWDEALGEVAGRLKAVIEEHGPDSVAFYVSGQLLTEDYYVANKLMKGFIGSANIDTNSRLCMASAVAAHNRAFGEDVVPSSYDDLDKADLILLVGSNTAWCHPVIWQRIEKARQQRGTKLVVIDPRRTETAERADLHIAISPDGDASLFNALLADLAMRGKLDRRFLADRCAVPEGFWEGLGGGNPTGGIAPAQFVALADLVAGNPRMVTLFSQGVNQSVGGTDKGNAIINLHLATGRIGKPGAGPFSITGQPNAMGGREVGGLANMLACHLGFSEAERRDVQWFWQAPALCSEPGLKAVDLFRAVHDGQIKFLWVMATNPAVSMPDAGFVREALARCPTVVVSDAIADTDTARFAHICLPALGWGEKDGTVTNSERRISRQRPLFAAPEEARADWRIVCDVAARLGHADAFDYAHPAAIFREYAAMTAISRKHGKLLDLTRWSDATRMQYGAMEPFQWGGRHPFESGFPTPDGKARLIVAAPVTAAQADDSWPLRLNTGRYRDQWHTMTRTGLSAKLSLHRREPLLEIHPVDAARFGVADGGLARVETPQGDSTYRVAFSEGQAPGQIFVPMHWTDTMAGSGRTGRLVHARVDPVSGQPGFKDGPARVEAVQPDWRAFLLTRDPVTLPAPYWVRARVKDGWLTELAGHGTADLGGLLPEGNRCEAADLTRGMQRMVVLDDAGALLAALFVTRSGELPPRDWLERQLGQSGANVAELLAGRPAAPMDDKGPTVCICNDVGEQAVFRAIADGASSVAQVGSCTGAGTNCGSCRPAIARLLEEARSAMKEAAQ
ncbi:nitrate reductase [Erythrobacter sp. SG61-1L]|uniref:nitrate reductase n=1 Tax=Erythrobacter sp. SG61-1L TaxID=1603897 RepID=UPI0006C928AD|nr:nitrate reductase [Erythrobacter sp. SG61-1L]KPL68365.1 nitrate reductase [Erythrobacter sp. SG61-1L]